MMNGKLIIIFRVVIFFILPRNACMTVLAFPIQSEEALNMAASSGTARCGTHSGSVEPLSHRKGNTSRQTGNLTYIQVLFSYNESSC